MKLWEKGYPTEKLIETFTIGNDYLLDESLAKYDVKASMAHAEMLASINILSQAEASALQNELRQIEKEIGIGNFTIEKSFEDIHSKLEHLLVEALGEVGKKIHSGRSRNDQVLVALNLYFKDQIEEIKNLIKILFETLQTLSEQNKDQIIPGYTHMQVAMPSSFGLWFGAYAESLIDDLYFLSAAFKTVNQNPLGSAAGYGTSFPLNRKMTTDSLGFETLKYNVIAAQMGRGKVEKSMGFAIASIAGTLAKLSMDICLYMGQNFGFISFPDHLTTGSSIMPHKKNPDVFELIRARCNRLQALPNELILVTTNLTSGYHRDFQELKDIIVPAISSLKSCLHIANYMLTHIEIKTGFMDDDKYKYIYSVENVNKLVLEGMSFRDAYQKIAQSIETGKYEPLKEINHSHEGSIGNLCNAEIYNKLQAALALFERD